MGTLTAGQPRLPHYCDHKLPTSCRLSSIGECCACYDERPHAASYRTYIDGVGFVPRGTRWQRYCWFCAQFWENRVEASGLRPGQTRIPERPDLTQFLQRWYEFHQGYRIVRHEDGSEERIAVLGEDFNDVSPGFLPRTIDELRAGRERSEMEEREREAASLLQSQQQEISVLLGPSLDETLDQMLQAAESEETPQSTHDGPSTTSTESMALLPSVQAQAMVPAGSRNREYQERRVAALRRELHRMRNGIERVISGLRDLGEDVPDHREASQRLSALSNTLDTISPPSRDQADQAISSVNALTSTGDASRGDQTLIDIQARVQEARDQLEEARRNRDQAQSELDVAEEEMRSSQSRLRQLQNQQRTTENYIRLFGTREEMLAQGENYESPIGGMFTRAWERFRAAEDVRREERTLRQILHDEERAVSEDVIDRLAELEARSRDVWGVPRSAELTDDEARRIASAARSTRLGTEERLMDSLTMARSQIFAAEIDVIGDARVFAGPPGQQLDEDPYANNDRGLDAMFVLSALSESETLRDALSVEVAYGLGERDIDQLIRAVSDSSLGREDRESIEIMMENEAVVWRCGLPAERNRRRRQRGETVTFTPDAQEMASAMNFIIHDVEIMAECYQLSSDMRNRSGLSPPAKLAMLYRLQRGERNDDDREVLQHMLQDDPTVSRAREIHDECYHEIENARRETLENARRQAARHGDHSRSELDSQRRATHAALAASRVAMSTSPAALLRQMADRDAESRAAYQRLQENGFAPPDSMTNRRLRDATYRPLNINDFTTSASASEEEESDGEGRGLDAKDTGRPEEPLTEEDMTVLLDCRICYSQKAEICTLPCGHLTMCRWCSDQHSPTMQHDRTRPRRAANCPVCRKGIRQKVKVIRA